jgi:hypothetical protein
MPITQDRFIAILDDADHIITMLETVKQFAQNMTEQISNANAVEARTLDPYAKKTIGELKGALISMKSFIDEGYQEASQGVIRIRTEQNVMKRVYKTNARAAYYQKRARIKQRVEKEGQNYVSPWTDLPEGKFKSLREQAETIGGAVAVTPAEDHDPNFGFTGPPQPLTQRMQDYLDGKVATLDEPDEAEVKAAAEARQAKLTRMREEDRLFTEQVKKERAQGLHQPTYDTEILSTSVPSLDELNKPPTAMGEDVF